MEKWVVVEEDQIETTWPCPSCKKINPGLTGTESESLRCVNCGYLKTTADRYILPADVEAAPAVTGIAAERARRGENFDCTYCGHSLRARTQRCENCGASVGAETVSAPFQPPPPPPPLKAPPPPSTRPRVTREKAVGASAPPPTSVYRTNARSYDSFEPPPRRTPNFFAWGAGLFAILFLCGVGWGIHQLTQPHKTVVRVVGGTWARTVTAYARQTYTDHGWRDTLHEETGTREQIVIGSCEERQDGTRDCEPSWPCNPAQVPDEASPRCTGGNLENYNCRNVTVNVPGTCRDVPQTNSPRCFTRVRDNGNGGARRQRICPTEEVCETQVERAGTWMQTPTWPSVSPANENRRLYYSEAYRVVFQDENDEDQRWTLTPRNEYEFARYAPRTRYAATYTSAGTFTLGAPVP